MVLLLYRWLKLELKDLSIIELFKELLSWNSESKLITPKYITGTYFGAIVAIFNFNFAVCFLGVMLFLTPERAPKAGLVTWIFLFLWNHLLLLILYNSNRASSVRSNTDTYCKGLYHLSKGHAMNILILYSSLAWLPYTSNNLIFMWNLSDKTNTSYIKPWFWTLEDAEGLAFWS